MIRLLVMIFVIVCCGITGCDTKIKVTEKKLFAADSIGWQENENYNFGGLVYSGVFNNELYIADPSACEIRVFDFDTFKFKRKFGVKGNGPGEFNFVGSFSIDNDGNVYIADPSSMKIVTFKNTGEYSETIKTDFPNTVKFLNNKMHVMEYCTKPNCNIKTIEDHEEKIEMCLDTIFVKNKLEVESRSYDFTQNGDRQFLVLHFAGKKFIDLKTGEDIMFPADSKGEYFVAGDFLESGDSFFIIQATMQNPEAGMEAETAKQYKEVTGTRDYVYQYNYNGELLNSLKIPDNVLLFPQSVSIAENYIIGQDVYTGNVFKFKII